MARAQIWHDTKINLDSSGLTPAIGEMIWEEDWKQMKIGDGSTVYADLPYIGDKVGDMKAMPSVGELWLECDGTAYNSITNTEYANLYSIIGNTYGGTDGSDFQVPNITAPVSGVIWVIRY